MKQLLLFALSLLFFSQATAQEYQVYDIKGNGSTNPVISVSNQTEGIQIEMSIESFQSFQVNTAEGTAERLILPGGINEMERGKPDLMHLSTSIMIPNTGKTVIRIDSSEYIDHPFFNITPSNGDPGLFGQDINTYYYDTAVYGQNAFFPAEVVQAHDPYILGNIRGQSIQLFPLQWNPSNKVLRVYHYIKLSVKAVNEPGVNELIRYSGGYNTTLESISRSNFSNASGNASGNALENSTENSSARYDAPEEQGNMLVIVHPKFTEAMMPFINWKNQKGISCEMIDVTTIGTEIDRAAAIRNYISEYYYSKGLTYLLLVGDAAYVPSNDAEKGVSDNMYGYIAGDDHYPEVLVGRFPCETSEECQTMVNRTINYEKKPSSNAAFNTFLGIGSGLGPGDDTELDFEHIRNIGTLLGSKMYPRQVELFDGSRGGKDLNGNPTAKMAADAINEGQGAIMYIGHGSANSWLTTGFSTIDAMKLTNSDTHPFIWAAGCNNGSFTNTTCLAEVFLRAENNGKPTGAVATLMSSANQSWYPPMEAQDEIALILSGNKANNSSSTFGGISLSGCMKMNDKYGKGAYIVTDNWILFGDPSVELRTSAPKTFKPQHSIMIGNDAFSFEVINVEPNAFICLSSEGSIITTMKVESETATINLPSISDQSKLTLTITGSNFIPYISEIEITNLPAVAVNPVPVNNSMKVSTTQNLMWDLNAGCVPESYTVCLRETGATLWEMYTVKSADSLNLPKLDYLTSYEWKVISINAKGQVESEVFRFKTIDRPDEDFEQSGFPRSNWINTHEWYVDNSEAFEGNYSLHSGSTVSRESSSLFFDCETLTCDYISFELKLDILRSGASIEFYLDGNLINNWSETIDWTNVTYQVEPGTHSFEWRFLDLNDSTGKHSAAWLDNIYLPINEPVTVASTTMQTCPASAIQLETEVSGYSSIRWESRGTGHFDDPSRMDAIYYPSDEELILDKINLNLIVTTNDFCDAVIYEYSILQNSLPQITMINDTVLYLNETMTIEQNEESEIMYQLFVNGSIQPSLEINSNNLITGLNNITLIAENNHGCTSTKQFSINVIGSNRPNDNVLTVYPNPTSEWVKINNPAGDGATAVSIFSTEGLMVENFHIDNLNGTAVQVSHLKQGMYIIRTESNGTVSTGRFIKI